MFLVALLILCKRKPIDPLVTATPLFQRIENSKNAPFRTDKILTFVPSIRPFAGESRPRFRMELNEELEGGIFSSNALMSTSAALHAGGLIVGKSSPRAFGSERGSKMSSAEEVKTFSGSDSIRRHASSK